MQAQRRRIKLLQRLGRMREVEKQSAVLRVAEAHGVHSKLLRLSERSGEIVAGYAGRTSPNSGAELAGQIGFLAGLNTIVRETDVERRKAEQSSQEEMQSLMLAERKLEMNADRLTAEKRAADATMQARENSMNPALARKLNSEG